MSIGTRLYTWMHGKFVGEDSFGNKYYEERDAPQGRRAKRWVFYKGAAEASKVPSEWHAWLHFTVDEPITPDQTKAWQKEHMPNLTGTPHAAFPSGDDRVRGKRQRSSGDYQAWSPEG